MKPPPLPPKTVEPILVTSEEIVGTSITRSLGMVSGNSTRALGFKGAFNFTGGGGEIPNLKEFQIEAQDEAERQMALEAMSLGADAVVGIRFQVSMLSAGLCSVFCYGTAVETLADGGE